jgi:hypothetical protein
MAFQNFATIGLILSLKYLLVTEATVLEWHQPHGRKLLQVLDPSFPLLLVLVLSFLGTISCLFQFRQLFFSMKSAPKPAKTPFSSDFASIYNSA